VQQLPIITLKAGDKTVQIQMKSLRAVSRALILTAGVAVASLVASVAPASAASGNVYVKFGDWHCSQGGNVTFVNGASVVPSGSTAYGVGGNKVSLFVWFNTRNSVTATVTCSKHPYWWAPWYTINYPVNIYDEGFWPTYAGQTFNL
jgi:hypothetical protein